MTWRRILNLFGFTFVWFPNLLSSKRFQFQNFFIYRTVDFLFPPNHCLLVFDEMLLAKKTMLAPSHAHWRALDSWFHFRAFHSWIAKLWTWLLAWWCFGLLDLPPRTMSWQSICFSIIPTTTDKINSWFVREISRYLHFGHVFVSNKSVILCWHHHFILNHVNFTRFACFSWTSIQKQLSLLQTGIKMEDILSCVDSNVLRFVF